MQPYFRENNLKLPYLDTDSFIYSLKPIRILVEDLKNFEGGFDFSDLDPSHEAYSQDNENYW